MVVVHSIHLRIPFSTEVPPPTSLDRRPARVATTAPKRLAMASKTAITGCLQREFDEKRSYAFAHSVNAILADDRIQSKHQSENSTSIAAVM